jgi:uncharacterized protein (DUF302 family)
MTRPAISFRVKEKLADAEGRVRQALQEQGFGILTEVDVQAVLRQRLGVETRPHKLLGACNPRIAHASIEAHADVGAFLPCGLSLREGETPEETIATVQNPAMISEAFGVEGLVAPSEEALALLTAALSKVGTQG